MRHTICAVLNTLIILAAIAGATLYLRRKQSMDNTQALEKINGLTAKVEKVGNETRTLLQKIQELTDAVNNSGNVSREVEAALNALQAQVDVVDELVPDAEPEPQP